MWTSVDYKPITPCLLEGLVELLYYMATSVGTQYWVY